MYNLYKRTFVGVIHQKFVEVLGLIGDEFPRSKNNITQLAHNGMDCFRESSQDPAPVPAHNEKAFSHKICNIVTTPPEASPSLHAKPGFWQPINSGNCLLQFQFANPFRCPALSVFGLGSFLPPAGKSFGSVHLPPFFECNAF